MNQHCPQSGCGGNLSSSRFCRNMQDSDLERLRRRLADKGTLDAGSEIKSARCQFRCLLLSPYCPSHRLPEYILAAPNHNNQKPCRTLSDAPALLLDNPGGPLLPREDELEALSGPAGGQGNAACNKGLHTAQYRPVWDMQCLRKVCKRLRGFGLGVHVGFFLFWSLCKVLQFGFLVKLGPTLPAGPGTQIFACWVLKGVAFIAFHKSRCLLDVGFSSPLRLNVGANQKT